MIHLIPRPISATLLNGTVFFSKNTTFTGAFAEIYSVLTPMLANTSAPQNTLTFVQDDSVTKEGYRFKRAGG